MNGGGYILKPIAKISSAEIEGMCSFFKVMSDPTRLRILTELMDGKLCVMHISERVGMSQSAISHQLAVLRKADLVKMTRNGKTAVYSISDEHVRLMLDMAMLHIEENIGVGGHGHISH
ncbi:MAG: winged helix-turn-helix transcriptional regulator [Clostridia bacterium]|nr:winged helix-turn-helix transcriptional regulator [Clostridia bacterium]